MKEEIQIIKEIAKDVAHSISWCNEVIPTVDCLGTAASLYDQGYRKQDEVATELLDEIIHMLDETSLAFQHGMSMKGIRTKGKTILYGKYEACSQFMSYLINLKNKYTSRGD